MAALQRIFSLFGLLCCHCVLLACQNSYAISYLCLFPTTFVRHHLNQQLRNCPNSRLVLVTNAPSPAKMTKEPILPLMPNESENKNGQNSYICLNHCFGENCMLIWFQARVSQNGWTKDFRQVWNRHFYRFAVGDAVNWEIFSVRINYEDWFWAYRCRCWIKNANVSRLACGKRLMAAYNSRTASASSTFWTAFEKFFHKCVGMMGSRRLRRKSLMQPQITWMSRFDSGGMVFARMNRSFNALMSFSEPDTR